MKEEYTKMVPIGNNQEAYLKDLQRSASVDAVSGLLNRAATEHYIKDRLQKMEQTDTCALLIVDLDDFKQVNDILGHPAGDQLIRQTAGILSKIFCANDIVGRLGGDEFVVFLCGSVTEEMVAEKAAEICEKLQMTLGDQETVNVTASVGPIFLPRGKALRDCTSRRIWRCIRQKKLGSISFTLKIRIRCMRNRFDRQISLRWAGCWRKWAAAWHWWRWEASHR